MREVLVCSVPAEDDEDNSEDETPELSLRRDRVARVMVMLEAKRGNGGLSHSEAIALEAATLRLYGAGASPRKFACLARQQVDGVLRGQYRFAGAGQTGRMSSKGAQIHNLTRDVLGDDGADEAALVDLIADGCDYQALVAARACPMRRQRAQLALLDVAPPSLQARSREPSCNGRTGRRSRRGAVTPWLADVTRRRQGASIYTSAPTTSDPFAARILHTLAAAVLLNKSPETITRAERAAIGKVATLKRPGQVAGQSARCRSVALNYRIHLDDAKARQIIRAWREANLRGGREFWGMRSGTPR
jgi:hypothetical protein